MGAGAGIICICSNNIKFLVDNAYIVNRLQKIFIWPNTRVGAWPCASTPDTGRIRVRCGSLIRERSWDGHLWKEGKEEAGLK